MTMIAQNRSVLPGQIYPVEVLDQYSGVYFLFHGEDLIYVGQAVNVPVRINNHRSTKEFTHFSWVRVPKEQLNDVEAEFIVELNPPQNKNLPNNSRYKPKVGARRACWRRYRKHPLESELARSCVPRKLLTPDKQVYYDLSLLFEIMDIRAEVVES